jgi:hypothetical protein
VLEEEGAARLSCGDRVLYSHFEPKVNKGARPIKGRTSFCCISYGMNVVERGANEVYVELW